MEHLNLLQLLLQVIGGLIGLLVIVIGWIGKRIHDRLDAINVTLGKIDRDLGEKVMDLNVRLTRVETTCDLHHVSQQ